VRFQRSQLGLEEVHDRFLWVGLSAEKPCRLIDLTLPGWIATSGLEAFTSENHVTAGGMTCKVKKVFRIGYEDRHPIIVALSG
jgi:hypothetical protein